MSSESRNAATRGFAETNVADVLTWHAAERPWAVAIIENDAVIHYGTLERLVWAAAWHLRQSGIGPGDVVGLALPPSALYLIAVYALARLGAVGTPLPVSDPPPVRAALVRRFGVKCLLAEAPGRDASAIPTIGITAESLGGAPASIPANIRAPGGERPWNIRRTSGTTAEAKGIIATHRALLARCAGQQAFFYGPSDRVFPVVSVDTAFGLTICERAIFGGAAVVLPPIHLNERQFLERLDRYAITHAAMTPNYLGALLPHLPTDGCRSPSLRQVAVTGMAMAETVRSEIRTRLCRGLLILYASNETAFLTAADAEAQERFPDTVGAAMPGVELEIVDDEDRPLPAGRSGHIRARTPWMPTGYVNAPEAAGRTFRNGWIYTGDIGAHSPEGMLFIRGRSDDMMNYNGIKIMPADIEAVLLAHPAVAEAVAFPIASSRHQHLPAAAVVLSRPVSGAELLAHCKQRLGARAPLAISIEAALPRNSMGKIVRRELAEKISPSLPASLR